MLHPPLCFPYHMQTKQIYARFFSIFYIYARERKFLLHCLHGGAALRRQRKREPASLDSPSHYSGLDCEYNLMLHFGFRHKNPLLAGMLHYTCLVRWKLCAKHDLQPTVKRLKKRVHSQRMNPLPSQVSEAGIWRITPKRLQNASQRHISRFAAISSPTRKMSTEGISPTKVSVMLPDLCDSIINYSNAYSRCRFRIRCWMRVSLSDYLPDRAYRTAFLTVCIIICSLAENYSPQNVLFQHRKHIAKTFQLFYMAAV